MTAFSLRHSLTTPRTRRDLLRLIREADITLEVALKQNDVHEKGGISPAGALFTAEGRHHPMRGRTKPYKGC